MVSSLNEAALGVVCAFDDLSIQLSLPPCVLGVLRMLICRGMYVAVAVGHPSSG